MSSETVTVGQQAMRPPNGKHPPKCRAVSAHTTLSAQGAPLVWLTGGALATALVMIVGLLTLVVYQGLRTFWPHRVVQLEVNTGDGETTTFLGEVTRQESFKPEPTFLEELKATSPELFSSASEAMAEDNGLLQRRLIWSGRTGALDFSGSRATWVNDFAIEPDGITYPDWAMVIERFDGGRSYGTPTALLVDDKPVAAAPAEVWDEFRRLHSAALDRLHQITAIERDKRGPVNRRLRDARVDLKAAELRLESAERASNADSARLQSARAAVDEAQKREESVKRWAEEEKAKIDKQVREIRKENDRFIIQFSTVTGESIELPLSDIVRAYPANQLSWGGKLRVYLSRWWEFLSAAPRESNTEGGVFPAIWGTVAMTIVMSILVVPFGVLAALYLREYAKAGPVVSAIRISINNLAGVPSIVFGVFGLGLFCNVIGASIDQLFFQAYVQANGSPVYGTGGLLWASLTLALLTVPVVIVATEEALAAVPNSMREGSYACGGSKWQTIWRIVLPRAMPGIMTGAILAMARGAGEVAPLILVGVSDLSPNLPVDGVFPFVHPERSFMHLAYQIYYVGFKSPNAEAAKPMVFTTTLLLISIVAFLNIAAVYLRSRLRRRFVTTQF